MGKGLVVYLRIGRDGRLLQGQSLLAGSRKAAFSTVQ